MTRFRLPFARLVLVLQLCKVRRWCMLQLLTTSTVDLLEKPSVVRVIVVCEQTVCVCVLNENEANQRNCSMKIKNFEWESVRHAVVHQDQLSWEFRPHFVVKKKKNQLKIGSRLLGWCEAKNCHERFYKNFILIMCIKAPLNGSSCCYSRFVVDLAKWCVTLSYLDAICNSSTCSLWCGKQ